MASKKQAKPESNLSHSQINASEEIDFSSSFFNASDETRSIAGQSVILGSDETRSEASYSQIHGSDETSSIASLSLRSLSSFPQTIGSDDERSTTPNVFIDGSDETRSFLSYSQINGSDETSTLASLSLRSNVSHIYGSDETWSEASFSLDSDTRFHVHGIDATRLATRLDDARSSSKTSGTSVSSRRANYLAGGTKQQENATTNKGIAKSKYVHIATKGGNDVGGNFADIVTQGGDEVGGKSADIVTQSGDEVGGKSADIVKQGGDEVGGRSADIVTQGGDEVGGRSADIVTQGGDEVGGKSADIVKQGGDEVGGKSADIVTQGGDEVGGMSADIANKCGDEVVGNDGQVSKPRHLYSVTNSRDINVRIEDDTYTSFIYEICQLHDGRLLMIDLENDKLKLLDQSYNVIDHCDVPGLPVSVCVCDEEACVGQWYKLQFVSIQEKMKMSRTMKLDHDCEGLVYRDGELYVSNGWANIHVYNKAGNHLRVYNIGTVVGKDCMFEYLTVSMDGRQLYMTHGNYLICMNRQSGEVIWSVKGDNKRRYRGVSVDKDNNVMVCDYRRRGEIIQYSSDGEKMGVIVDGLECPTSICFDQESETILVGKMKSDVISVVNIK